MTITYTWSVTQMDAYPELDGEQDVVCMVWWTLVGTDGGCSDSTGGGTPITVDGSEPFTPYSQLTQEQVLGWVFDKMGPDVKTQIEQSVASQVAKQAAKIQPMPLPW